MKKEEKRGYQSKVRESQARGTKESILNTALKLFQTLGYEDVTINKIAFTAQVSAPSIYAIFKSKLGILRVLMDSVLPENRFNELVQLAKNETSPRKRLQISAKIARLLYDAEASQMELFQGASILSPDLKKLEEEKEDRRYHRLQETVQQMVDEKSLAPHLTKKQAHDILWTFTGRDLYRLLVKLRGWSSDDFENWLAELLYKTLVQEDK